jgi:glycine cleavage system H protein
MKAPAGLRYTRSHEWVRREDDGTVTIGISEHAQDALGELVYVELPKVGRSLAAGETFGVVESVKAVSDVYAPVAGEVTAVNDALSNAPETINSDPYEGGWIMRLRPADPADVDALLDEAGYDEVLKNA